MQEHLHLSRRLLDGDLLSRVFKAPLLYRPEEHRRLVTAGIGEDRLAAWREQLRYEVGESGCVLSLVEDVRGEDQIERPDTLHVRFAPVEKGDLRFQAQVRAGVVGREVEGCLVVIRSKDIGAFGEREYGGESDAASELDGAYSPKTSITEVARQRDGAGPEFGPVREPLVAVEVFLVNQVVRRDGMGNAVCPAPNLDRGFGQTRKAAEMG